jgi:c-di-GMP-binding flagellar brake protein YcgR
MFRKKPTPPPEYEEPLASPVDPRVLEILDRLEKAGVQLTVRLGKGAAYTTAVVGLGKESFFVDTLSPPDGDQLMKPGTRVDFETLFQGTLYLFEARAQGRVRFVDELPAFRVGYPEKIRGERRRKTPRVPTPGDASLSFLQPFACDAPVVNVSEGGVALEYGAELGRLRRGTVLKDLLLELGSYPVISIQARVVAQVVCELGGLGLPRRYRVSLAFQGLSASDMDVVRAYLQDVTPVDFQA